MASGRVTFIAFLVMFIVFSADFSSVMATRVANTACCQYHNIGKCEYSNYADNQRCNDFCKSSCRGGACESAVRDVNKQRCLCFCQ
ncbi:hypothetical protein C5167_010734 [Papaver somniferum]|uniref:Knottin scorpion toxin-like domain-containing protein n=1 Tax=Papaver somniferum TaxID=3469 RepID=A0A4Y7K475_PAPSO|nr:hypothetical protein C5167_010734 [Papaver somniferum]